MNRSVKRIIALAALWLCAAFAIAQAPIGVCINNVAQTISNGVIAPIPYATVALCTPGSTASNCVANKVNIYTSTALSTATPTNPFMTDAGGNYYFCAYVGHYGLLINSSYGQYFVPDVTLDDNWAAGGTMTGTLTDAAGFIGPLTGNVTGNVSGNAGTSSASDHSPTQCGSGSYSQGYSTTWAANCAQVNWSQLGSIPSFYYQTVQEAGTTLPQQPVLNFDGTVVASAGSGKTNVGLPSVCTAGTYTNPSSITVDSYGRTTAVTSGSYTAAVISQPSNTSNVIYENTTGRNVFLSVVATAHATTYTLLAGSTSSVSNTLGYVFTSDAGSSAEFQITGIIPPNWYYEVTGGSVINWTETTM